MRCHFWLPAAIGSLFMAALIGWLARPLSQRPDQLRSSLADLLDHDSTVGSSVVPKVPPGADHVPLEIRVPGEADTIYNETFEDVGLFMATPPLPFATLGTLGWAHSDQALDDGS